MTASLRSGELADAAGVNLQTLRYYERRGLLAEPRRSPGGHRLYPQEALIALRVTKTAQRLGFTLDEVAELVDLGTHHDRRRDTSLQRRAAAKLTEIEAKIADLQVIAQTLRQRSTPDATTWPPARPPTAARCRSPTSTEETTTHEDASPAAATALAWWWARLRPAHMDGCSGGNCSCAGSS